MNEHDPEQRTPEHNVALLVAVYNNASSVLGVLDGLAASGLPVFVVDDGSTDGTASVLADWVAHGGDNRRLATRAKNGGKAAALRDGFAWIAEEGHTHALTVDADGQHEPTSVPAFLAALDNAGPQTLIAGSREPIERGYPLKNRIGRITSNIAIRAQCGALHGDVPCGMRLYPLAAVRALRCVSGRYAWEEEFITRAVWAGFGLKSVRIRSLYAPGGTRQSHYKFSRDWTEGMAIYLWLFVLALLPVARFFRNGVFFFPPAVRGGSMAARTEQVFVTGSALIAFALGALLPESWYSVALLLWLAVAWHVPLWVFLLGIALPLGGVLEPMVGWVAAISAGVTFAFGLIGRQPDE